MGPRRATARGVEMLSDDCRSFPFALRCLMLAGLLGACASPPAPPASDPAMPTESQLELRLPTLRSLSFSPELCRDAQDAFIVAHQDDDLLFMNPDIAEAVRQNHCVVTLYLTAGDNEYGIQPYGLDYTQYWRSREDGERAAYARMAGVPNVWTQQIYPFAGKEIRTSVLDGNPRVRLMFLRLRENTSSGVTLRALWDSPDPTLTAQALDHSNAFTRQDVINVLANMLSVSEAKYVHLQDSAPVVYGTRVEHPDHIAAGKFAEAADRLYTAPHVTVAYRDYNIGAEPQNVTAQEFTAKLDLFKTYAAFDPMICPPSGGVACVAPGESGSFYVDWSRRQYFHVDVAQGGTLIRRSDGRLAAFVIGDRSSSPRRMTQLSPNSTAWSGWETLDGRFPAAPGVVSLPDGRLAMVERGNDGRTWARTELAAGGAWGPWVDLGGVVSSVPVAVQDGGGLSVFVRGNDGFLYVKSLSSFSSWGDWIWVPGPRFTSAPAVARDRTGGLRVFVRATDGTVQTAVQSGPGGSWGTWTSLGGLLGPDAQPVAGQDQDGRLEVFVRGGDNLLYQRWQTAAGNWGGWSQLGSVAFTGTPRVSSAGNGALVVTVRGLDGRIRAVRQTGPNAGWQGWTDLGGPFTALVGTERDAQGRTVTLARGTDDLMYVRDDSATSWTALGAP